MTKKTYLFYDTETSGLNPCFDQILQFAAIRTDLALNELERYEFKIRLHSDVIPSPAALITHRLGIAQMLAGEEEYTIMRNIHGLFNKPGTISVGYNNLGFDDEFLRFAFYRNFLSPYTHQFANECQRIDLYPITIMYHLHQPEAIQWPEINGHYSLKLENLNAINQFTAGRAHDAMVDVLATLGLARKFYAHTKTWEYVLGNFDKVLEGQRQQKLPNALNIGAQSFLRGLMIKGKLGAHLAYQAPVMKLGQHYHYKNQSIWLRLDTPLLIQTTLDSINTTTFTIRKKAGEQEFLLPLEDKYSANLTNERKALLQKNQHWLQQNPQLVNAICQYHLDYKYPHVENVDSDAALYTLGFPSKPLESLFQQFHYVPQAEKMQVANLFPDALRREQALRLMARNFPQYLTASEQQEFAEQRYHLYAEADTTLRLPIDFRGQTKLNKYTALEQCQQLLQQDSLDNEQRELLKNLQQFLQ